MLSVIMLDDRKIRLLMSFSSIIVYIVAIKKKDIFIRGPRPNSGVRPDWAGPGIKCILYVGTYYINDCQIYFI